MRNPTDPRQNELPLPRTGEGGRTAEARADETGAVVADLLAASRLENLPAGFARRVLAQLELES